LILSSLVGVPSTMEYIQCVKLSCTKPDNHHQNIWLGLAGKHTASQPSLRERLYTLVSVHVPCIAPAYLFSTSLAVLLSIMTTVPISPQLSKSLAVMPSLMRTPWSAGNPGIVIVQFVAVTVIVAVISAIFPRQVPVISTEPPPLPFVVGQPDIESPSITTTATIPINLSLLFIKNLSFGDNSLCR